MTVRPVDILVIAAALGVVLFVALLPSPRDNNPAVPDTAEHRGLRTERECLRCHTAGASQALPEHHPSRTDCFRCHRLADGVEGSRTRGFPSSLPLVWGGEAG